MRRVTAGKAESEIEAAVARSVFIIVGVTAASMLACIIAIIVIAAKVAGPLKRLVQATERIAQGDLSARVPAEGQDEIGSLADAFNTVGGVLRSLIGRVQESIGDMGATDVTQESYAASQEMARVARSVLASVESIAAVSEESAASVEQISASTQQVNAGMRSIAEAAGKLQRVAAKVGEEIGMLKLEGGGQPCH